MKKLYKKHRGQNKSTSYLSLEFVPENNNWSPLLKRAWSQYVMVCLVKLKRKPEGTPPSPPPFLSEAAWHAFLSSS